MASFNELGLSQAALEAVDRLGYTAPTPVQEQAIPLVLQGRDIIAAAKTGTGKTAAFSLPALDRIGTVHRKRPAMLVLTPTRELANQITSVCEEVVGKDGRRVACVVGGVGIEPQIKRLKSGVDVLIATPGRLLDLMGQNAVDLSAVEVLVLDEADRMLDMGFLPSVKRIVAAVNPDRQTLLFSATVDGSIMDQVGSMLHNPAMVQIAAVGETADTITQYVYRVPKELRTDLLAAVLKDFGWERIIVFVRTRRRADSLCRRLKKLGYKAEAIHSDRSQNQRDRALRNFASGTTDIIVATDVLARGIDVQDVAYVVNFDVPAVAEDYVHRIGRTGRAGAGGFSLSFVIPETEQEWKAIEKFIKRKVDGLDVPSFNEEDAASALAARANRAAARKDPDIAQATKELKAKEKRKRKAAERGGSAGRGGQKGAAKRPAASGDMRPGRSHRAAVARQRRRPR